MKIGFKIGIGISVLTALAATIGLIAIMGMGIIKKESNALSKESLPGLNSAYRADKTWRETMFYLKSYDYTSSPFYYRWGKKSLDKFKNSLGILEKLSNESSVNKKNSEKLDEIKVQLNEFETVLDDGYKLESKNEYYISDLKKYSLKLQAISGGNLSIYAKCMTLSNNIIHAINSRTPKELLLAQQYASSFESEVRQIKDNGEFGETAFNLFETAKKLIPSYIAARTLELKRHEISNIMKEGIRELSDVGVNQINEMSEITNGIIVKSRSTLFIILIGILFLGVVFGVIITYSITSALKRGVDLAVNISNGELHDQEEVDRKDEIGELMNALNRMNNQLKFIVEDITTGFKNILIASNEINRNATELSEAAIDQAATTEEISSSIEELHANFLQNAENANTTEEIAMAAVEGIRDGNKATEMASKSLDAIIERIGFIGDLAFQTNILALNAAVEAARAGDHGRGFAVVAGEVKRLADSSKEAAEIINKVSRETMVASDQAGDKLRKIVPEIEKTAQLIQGIKLASNEQEVGINQINNAIQQLNNIAQLNAESSEKLSFSSIKLADLSNKFQKTISFFKVVKSGKK